MKLSDLVIPVKMSLKQILNIHFTNWDFFHHKQRLFICTCTNICESKHSCIYFIFTLKTSFSFAVQCEYGVVVQVLCMCYLLMPDLCSSVLHQPLVTSLLMHNLCVRNSMSIKKTHQIIIDWIHKKQGLHQL